MLQLNHIDKATDEDVKNGLVYWAQLFKADTWEQFKALADGNEVIEEVGTLIFELNYDNQAKEIMEGRRRYREQLATSYASGKIDGEKAGEEKAAQKFIPIIAEKDAALANRDATIAELQARVQELESLKR